MAYHHVAGLPYREVAGILGGTPEAARRAAADGIKRLRAVVPGPSSTPEIPTSTIHREEVLQ